MNAARRAAPSVVDETDPVTVAVAYASVRDADLRSTRDVQAASTFQQRNAG